MEDIYRSQCKLQIKQLPRDTLEFASHLIDYYHSVNDPHPWDKVAVSITSDNSENRLFFKYRRVRSLKPEVISKAITLLMEVDPQFIANTVEFEHISMPIGL